MIIDDFESLSMVYKTCKNIDEFECICEVCKKPYKVKRSTVSKLKKLNNKKLVCKPCKISLAKQSYSEQQKKEIQSKREMTNELKYGHKNTWQLEKVKEMSHNRDWSERNNNSKKTCLEKYGVENGAQTEQAKQKTKITLIKKHGSIKAAYEKRRQKIEKTNLEKRGHKSNFQDEGFHQKSIQGQINTYGRPIYSRTYIYNDICFDSSWELAYFIWLKDAGFEYEYQPKCDFYYIGSDEKEHQYFPDFLVNGEYQEIKGKQFFNEKGEPYCSITKSYWWEKYNFIKNNNIKLLTWDDLKPIIEYIHKTYGSTYLKSFKVKV